MNLKKLQFSEAIFCDFRSNNKLGF